MKVDPCIRRKVHVGVEV